MDIFARLVILLVISGYCTANNSLQTSIATCASQLAQYCTKNSTTFCNYMLTETLALKSANTSCADAFVHLKEYSSSTYLCNLATVGGAVYIALGCASGNGNNENLAELGGVPDADASAAKRDVIAVAANATATSKGIPTTATPSSSSIASTVSSILRNLTKGSSDAASKKNPSAGPAAGPAAGPGASGSLGISGASPMAGPAAGPAGDYIPPDYTQPDYPQYSSTYDPTAYYDPQSVGYTDTYGYTNTYTDSYPDTAGYTDPYTGTYNECSDGCYDGSTGGYTYYGYR